MDEVALDEAASSPPTVRQRRRSFYENMEPPEASAFAPPDSAQPHAPAADGAAASSAAAPSSSSVLPADVDAAPSASPSPRASNANSNAAHGYRGGVAGALAQWLLAALLTLLYRLHRRLRLHERAPFRLLRQLRERSAAAAAVKHWAYPTQWLALGCASLVAAQLVVYWHFQLEHFDLRVRECVFHEHLLASAGAASSPVTAGVARPSAQSARYLERRFEQLHDHAGGARTHKNRPRMPWTCISIVATDDDARTRATAADLALLLPRHRLLAPNATHSVASRLQLVVGGAASVARSPHSGVVGALFPSSSLPDLVLVKTEYALQRMVALRQARQEEEALLLSAEHDSRAQFAIYLTKATVPDIYQRRVQKNWDAFLHVVVAGMQDDQATNTQLTKQLLATWLQHPEWPTLHVRFANSLELCGSFARYVSSVKRSTEEEYETEEQKPPVNIDLSCDETANSRAAVVEMKNRIGMHVFPTPPEAEEHEDVALESLAAGAMVITYNSPVMQEWVPEACGLRVGSFELPAEKPEAAAGVFLLPMVRVTPSDIERAVEAFVALDRVNRVAKGRAARAQYLRLRTHYLSAMAALDAAVCDDDTDDALEVPSDIGHRSRTKVEMEPLRVFLY